MCAERAQEHTRSHTGLAAGVEEQATRKSSFIYRAPRHRQATNHMSFSKTTQRGGRSLHGQSVTMMKSCRNVCMLKESQAADCKDRQAPLLFSDGSRRNDTLVRSRPLSLLCKSEIESSPRWDQRDEHGTCVDAVSGVHKAPDFSHFNLIYDDPVGSL